MPRNDSTLGLYVSVPFCRQKCTFCNFASDAFPPAKMAAYVQRLSEEMASSCAFAVRQRLSIPSRVDSIFVGGGTPSLLEPVQMRNLFVALRAAHMVDADAEITVEAAPGQIPDALLDVLLESGVNRISLGVQSFIDAESRAVGRTHTAASCHEELRRLRSAGITNRNIDLIAGLPHQTQASWAETLQEAVGCGAEHVSVYMLEVDEDSRLGREMIGPGVRYGAHAAPTESLVADLYAQACEILEAADVRQYEISNFARHGYRSRHNEKYWRRDPYLGFGLDAHSMLRTEQESRAARFANGDSLGRYLSAVDRVDVEHIDQLGEWEESIFLGLRLTEGVSIADLRDGFPSRWIAALLKHAKALEEDGLMQLEGGRIFLTAQGRILSSSIFGELLANEPLPAESLPRL